MSFSDKPKRKPVFLQTADTTSTYGGPYTFQHLNTSTVDHMNINTVSNVTSYTLPDWMTTGVTTGAIAVDTTLWFSEAMKKLCEHFLDAYRSGDLDGLPQLKQAIEEYDATIGGDLVSEMEAIRRLLEIASTLEESVEACL